MVVKNLLKVNFGTRHGKKPLILVIHCIGLPSPIAESAISHFSNPNNEVSSHYIVKRNGDVIQLVEENLSAWCNGQIGNNLPKNPVAKFHYQLGISLNDISISIETEASEVEDLTLQGYKSLANLVRDICIRWQIPLDRNHICGHRDIKDTKTCPGKVSVEKVISLALVPPIQPEIPTPIISLKISTQPDPVSTQITLLQKLLILYQKLLSLLLERNKLGGVARSGRWFAFRKQHIKKECEACGKKGTFLNPLELHHVKSFSQFPELECDPENVMTGCRRCHQLIFHLDNFRSINENARADARALLQRIKARP